MSAASASAGSIGVPERATEQPDGGVGSVVGVGRPRKDSPQHPAARRPRDDERRRDRLARCRFPQPARVDVSRAEGLDRFAGRQHGARDALAVDAADMALEESAVSRLAPR